MFQTRWRKKEPIMSDTQTIVTLRKQTGAGMMDCKKALDEAGGDIEKAVDILRKSGAAKAAKRAGREAREGIVYAYIHSNNRIGAMVELNCETDFVARNEDFKQLAHDIGMQIVAQSPLYLAPEDVSAEAFDREKDVYRDQLKQEGKPEEMIEKIVEGKMAKYYSEVCLLKQSFIKDDSVTIEDVITQANATMGEKVVLRRFSRFEI